MDKCTDLHVRDAEAVDEAGEGLRVPLHPGGDEAEAGACAFGGWRIVMV